MFGFDVCGSRHEAEPYLLTTNDSDAYPARQCCPAGPGPIPAVFCDEVDGVIIGGRWPEHTLSDEEYSVVLVFHNDQHPRYNDRPKRRQELREARHRTLLNLARAGLVTKTRLSASEGQLYVLVGAPQRFLEMQATQLEIPVKVHRETRRLNDNDEMETSWEEYYVPFDMLNCDDVVELQPEGNQQAKAGSTYLEMTEAECDCTGVVKKPAPSRFFRSKPRIQIILQLMRDKWSPEDGRFGAEVNTTRLMTEKLLIDCFPLHGPGRQRLRESWADFRLMLSCHPIDSATAIAAGERGSWKGWKAPSGTLLPWGQPIDEIRDYFGEKLAFYFAFLSFYTQCLLVLGLPGFAVGVVYYSLKGGDADKVAQWSVVIYAFVVVLWASFFLEAWKREQQRLAQHWGMRGFDERDPPRAEFISKGCGVYDSQLDDYVYKKKDARSQRLRRSGSYAMVVVCTGVVCGIMLVYVGLTGYLEKHYGMSGMRVAATAILAVCILVLGELLKALSAWLTNKVNYRTQSEFNENLVLKTFPFQFVNSYFVLYAFAFVKPWADGGHAAGTWQNATYAATESNVIYDYLYTCSCDQYSTPNCYELYCTDIACTNVPAAQCECVQQGCAGDVGIFLGFIFAFQIVIQNFLEVLGPVAFYYLRARFREIELSRPKRNMMRSQEDLSGSSPAPRVEDLSRYKSSAEKEFELPDYEVAVYCGVFQDYSEVVVQYGYVALFSVNFPFVAVLAFINNIIEIRSDAFKLVVIDRRPAPEQAENIGSWTLAMTVMGFFAVTTNAAHVFLVSPLIEDWDWSWRLFGLFLTEHIVYGIKFGLDWLIPDTPEGVQYVIDCESVKRAKAHRAELLTKANRHFSNEMSQYRPFEKTPPPPYQLLSSHDHFEEYLSASQDMQQEITLTAAALELDNEVPTRQGGQSTSRYKFWA